MNAYCDAILDINILENVAKHQKKTQKAVSCAQIMSSVLKGTAAGIHDFRRLRIGRCGGLRGRALLASDCCPVHEKGLSVNEKSETLSVL